MRIRSLLLPIAIGSALVAQAQPAMPPLAILKNYLIGSYSSAAQARQDTSYLNIELEVARIWLREKDGVWLYVEQAVAERKDKPYRQRIYHLTQRDDSTFISTVCTLDSMHLFVGAFKDVARFNGLKPTDARPLPGCALVLHLRKGHFVGSTNGRECINAWGKAAYATSEVDITSNMMISWDRGYDAQGEQVWGAEKGGYRFVKKPARMVPVRPASDN